jgi:hypothetical protein
MSAHATPHPAKAEADSGMRWRLSFALLLGEWRAHPLRALVAVAAIAVGIALGFAIHLMNAAAFNEFSSAIKGLSGVADIQIRATEPCSTRPFIRTSPSTQVWRSLHRYWKSTRPYPATTAR